MTKLLRYEYGPKRFWKRGDPYPETSEEYPEIYISPEDIEAFKKLAASHGDKTEMAGNDPLKNSTE